MQQDRTPFHIDTPFGLLAFERLANIYRQVRDLCCGRDRADVACNPRYHVLLRTEPRVLQRYMGGEQAAAFIQHTREQPRNLADTHAVS
jgi:hypothetical protein